MLWCGCTIASTVGRINCHHSRHTRNLWLWPQYSTSLPLLPVTPKFLYSITCKSSTWGKYTQEQKISFLPEKASLMEKAVLRVSRPSRVSAYKPMWYVLTLCFLLNHLLSLWRLQNTEKGALINKKITWMNLGQNRYNLIIWLERCWIKGILLHLCLSSFSYLCWSHYRMRK